MCSIPSSPRSKGESESSVHSPGLGSGPRQRSSLVPSRPQAVQGVAAAHHPDYGETVKAWIVLKPGQEVTADEIKAWCKERLAAYKVPTHYEFRQELPKTTIGKILRRELVKQHNETPAAKA